jgi:SWI/SNF-related matrix-associated actin-dependent regulator of chromatin subfamily A3
MKLTIDTRIVGIRYYQGTVSRNQYVLFVREPQNPADQNAIRVHNVANILVG